MSLFESSPTPPTPSLADSSDQPRERALEDGITTLGDAELLSVLLGTGLAGRPVALVAAGLLERAGGLTSLARLSPAAIAEHPGLGLAKALRISAALELGRRASLRSAAPRPDMRHSRSVAAYLVPRIGSLDHEELWLLCLDGRNHFRSMRRLAVGGTHGLSVSPREVMRVALAESAACVVLAHNHPSGDTLPSPEDIELTRRACAAGTILNLPVVDHVIVAASGRYCSMLDMGLVKLL